MIKKHYKLIICFLVIFIVFLIYKENHIHYFNYTSLGDGYALGINSYQEINYGYSDFIKDDFMKSKKLKLYTKNFSDKNESIKDLYEDLVTNKKITNHNVQLNLKQTIRESNLITMTVGLNDLIYHIAITENMNEYKLDKIMKEIEKNLEEFLQELKKYYPQKIYMIGYPNIPFENVYINKGIKKLNELFANMDNVIYIPTTTVLTNQDFLNPNSIYPSKEGYYKIAKEVLKKLAKQENT